MERAGGDTGPFLYLGTMSAVRKSVPVLIILAALCEVPSLAADDAPIALRSAGTFRVHLDYPAIVSVGFGVITARMPASYACDEACLFRGFTISGAAGPRAGEIALGYGSLAGETGRGRWMMRPAFVGYGVRAAVERTWGSGASDDHRGDTYVGVEGAFGVAQAGLRLGVFRRVGNVQGEGDWRVFGGIGWGF